jgi:hypothetical protein
MLKAYANAKDKLERVNNTWELSGVNWRLAKWYWDACVRPAG